MVGDTVESICRDSCILALEEEIQLTKEAGEVDADGVALLCCSGDMGCTTRGSGRTYASFCGCFTLIGCHTGKVLYCAFFDKMCAKCEHALRTNKPRPEHRCFKGAYGIYGTEDGQTTGVVDEEWTGSSKAMETHGAFMSTLAVGLYRFEEFGLRARISSFIADEDSTMRARMNGPNVPVILKPVIRVTQIT
ncbi:hypothetical protein CYMTET_17877 [Cymbomonas tetramitiformis]|uniref:Mutator-like transposase domain-containing protein n=1 Tax=Cymbomonas tetramitiformis TaxID=36881 RepID=A0AAE0G912_9CHLO|nr:hypothetical protein CYMTET_17877 [Cymbomonas tetramitiformis]